MGKPQENFNPIANSPQNKPSFDKSGFAKSEHVFGESTIGILEGYELAYEKKIEGNEKFRDFVDSLTGKEKIVDLGAGLGSAMVNFLHTHNKADNVLSLDLDFRNVKQLSADNKNRANTPELKTAEVQADAVAAPLRDAFADIVVCAYIIADNEVNMYEKYPAILKEITRIIRPGGILITNEDLDDGNIVDLDNFLPMFFLNSPDSVMTFYRKKV